MGQNSVDDHRSSPVQVGSSTDWRTTDNSIACSGNLTMGIKTNGTLWGFGNSYGTMGSPGASNRRSSPVQFSSDTTWSKITIDRFNSCLATKTDGTMWAWGSSLLASNGLNNDNNYWSPVQMPGTDWGRNISRSYIQGSAIKTDGTLWMWGDNRYGTLGQNSRTERSSPVQIPGTTWSKATHYNYHTVHALKTDGTLWAWGASLRGSLGLSGTPGVTPALESRSSPVQIGTDTDWIDIKSVYYGVNALKSGT